MRKYHDGLYRAVLEYYKDIKHDGFYPHICYNVKTKRAYESYVYGENNFCIYKDKAVVKLPMYNCAGLLFREALRLCEEFCNDFDCDYQINPDEYDGVAEY